MIPRFRAWHKIKKRMIYDIDSIDFKYEAIVESEKNFKDNNKETYIMPWVYNFDDIILMQSTGLKDINGKEIFEGDIVKMYDCIYEIKQDTDNCRFCMNGIDNPNYGRDSLYLCKFKLDHIEIIGNIYENPELLEVK